VGSLEKSGEPKKTTTLEDDLWQAEALSLTEQNHRLLGTIFHEAGVHVSGLDEIVDIQFPYGPLSVRSSPLPPPQGTRQYTYDGLLVGAVWWFR